MLIGEGDEFIFYLLQARELRRTPPHRQADPVPARGRQEILRPPGLDPSRPEAYRPHRHGAAGCPRRDRRSRSQQQEAGEREGVQPAPVRQREAGSHADLKRRSADQEGNGRNNWKGLVGIGTRSCMVKTNYCTGEAGERSAGSTPSAGVNVAPRKLNGDRSDIRYPQAMVLGEQPLRSKP